MEDLQSLLSSMPSHGTAIIDTKRGTNKGVAEGILNSLYNTQSTDDMLTYLDNIYKSTSDPQMFNNISNKDSKFIDHKNAAEMIVYNAFKNLPYQNNTHTLAEYNLRLPVTFSKTLCEFFNESHQNNGKHYFYEVSISNTNADDVTKGRAVLAGLASLKDELQGAVDYTGEWSQANASGVVDLLEFIHDTGNNALFQLANDLITQQNMLANVLRIMENLASAARVAGNTQQTSQTATNEKSSCYTLADVKNISEFATTNNTSKLSSLNDRDMVANTLTADEMVALGTLGQYASSGQLNKLSLVDAIDYIKDKNVVNGVIAGVVTGQPAEINDAIQSSIIASALRRANVTSCSDGYITSLTQCVTNNVDIRDIIKYDIINDTPLTRMYAHANNDAEAEYLSLNVLPSVTQYGQIWLNTYKQKYANQSNQYKMETFLKEQCAEAKIRGSIVDNSKYLNYLASVLLSM